ncbi:MAG: DHH family phosphoesterase, partial [Muribaculaceae bacterium]|nr:DHH family phosphoesterase [Muribaculaceae bacterium]
MTEKWIQLNTLREERSEGAGKAAVAAVVAEGSLSERFAELPVVLQLLHGRGIHNQAQADEFFHPSLQKLHDPFLMPGMDRAVRRLNEAMGAKEKILVYGDYDVDGTTAVALVYKYLSQFYSGIDFYIPGRYDDGYGISKTVIDHAADAGIKLIIILDCGIKANEEIAYAKTKGIDFI